MTRNETHAWWQKGVIYQVYPWSFQDSNADGIGDLPGIEARLDYLAWLGVDAIWISPIYPSPMADFGYDISDYRDVDPRFGTLRDFDALLAKAHALGLKVILDFVPNHTSEAHPWFIAARSSREDPHRDYYIWRDPAPDGGPPTNWLSEFGGPAWELDQQTGQYYYHAYLKQQPDLNFRNPQVEQELLGVLRFWLERGVDGFRVDAVHHLIKDSEFRDNPSNPDFVPTMAPHKRLLRRYTTDLPEVHEAIAKMRRVVNDYPNRVLIGEAYLPIDRLMTYYGSNLSGVHLPFNFQLLQSRWEAAAIASLARSYEAALPAGGWPNWVLGNHDRSRIASRVGDAQARVAALLLLTLRGTPTLYYGDELGMKDLPIPAELVRDPFERNVPGMGLGRDPERTPMQWTSGLNAGFSSGTPWLPLPAEASRVNVELQQKDPTSLLAFYRKVLALRRAEPALSVGAYESLDAGASILSYERSDDQRSFEIVLSFSTESQLVSMPGASGKRLVLSTDPQRAEGIVDGTLVLAPNEGVVLAREKRGLRSG
ncbi:MAG TPA: alpha-amylase family glycosyl hydrolase [Polyangiaceae bacterium]|nr:alpha-amylase family glycosyl hydrolase [Polyangiaceae bacterium]